MTLNHLSQTKGERDEVNYQDATQAHWLAAQPEPVAAHYATEEEVRA